MPSSPLTVSSLVREIKDLLESGFPLVLVEGEISNLARPGSGHLYFTLKDAGAQLRCAMFRNRAALLRFLPQDGAHVLVRARITVYEPRGDLQLVIEHIEEAGLGALQRAFEMLKQRLATEGLFNPDRKRPLPALPHRIGIITSPSGAAIRDVLHVLKRRFPLVPLRIYPSTVQGATAADELVQAIQLANQRAECDVLLLVRGGGSLEDLWPFNEERLARAVAASAIPIISGVGHETDTSIADFVADARAPTPSAAAALAVPDAGSMLEPLQAMEARLQRRMNAGIERRAQYLDAIARHLQALHPQQRLKRMSERLDGLTRRLGIAQRLQAERHAQRLGQLEARLTRLHPSHGLRLRAFQLDGLHGRLMQFMKSRLAQNDASLRQLAGHLHVLSPLATLERGYALIEDARGHVLTRCVNIKPADTIRARMHDGVVSCEVRSIQRD